MRASHHDPFVAAPEPTGFRKLRVAENFYQRQHQSDGGAQNSKSRQGSARTAGGRALPPQLLMCYLCGHQFGTQSLAIHQPQCYYKKLLQWEREDVSVRGAKPLHPDEHQKQAQAHKEAAASAGTAQSLDDWNDQQYQKFVDGLVPCERCGRRFYPDRLVVHLRSCKGSAASVLTRQQQPKDSVPVNLSSGAMTAREPLEPCPSCGRRYVSSKLPTHVLLCKGNVPRQEVVATTLPSQQTSQRQPSLSPSRRQQEEEEQDDDNNPIAPNAFVPRAMRAVSVSPQRTRSRSGGGRLRDVRTIVPPHERNITEVTSNVSQLSPCQFCGRKFAPARLEKHESVCVERKGKVSYYQKANTSSVRHSLPAAGASMPSASNRRPPPAAAAAAAATTKKSNTVNNNRSSTATKAAATVTRKPSPHNVDVFVDETAASASPLEPSSPQRSKWNIPSDDAVPVLKIVSTEQTNSTAGSARESPARQQRNDEVGGESSGGEASAAPRAKKFCEECGVRFAPNTQPKFCSECGTRQN